jgi:hypothetical protein
MGSIFCPDRTIHLAGIVLLGYMPFLEPRMLLTVILSYLTSSYTRRSGHQRAAISGHLLLDLYVRNKVSKIWGCRNFGYDQHKEYQYIKDGSSSMVFIIRHNTASKLLTRSKHASYQKVSCAFHLPAEKPTKADRRCRVRQPPFCSCCDRRPYPSHNGVYDNIRICFRIVGKEISHVGSRGLTLSL